MLLVPQDLEVGGVEFQTCYLQEVAKTVRTQRLSPNQKLALDTLISGTKGSVSQRSMHLDAWRSLFYTGHTGDSEDTKKKAFQRTRESLVHKGFVEVTDDIYSVRDTGTYAGHSQFCPARFILSCGTVNIRLYERRISVPPNG